MSDDIIEPAPAPDPVTVRVDVPVPVSVTIHVGTEEISADLTAGQHDVHEAIATLLLEQQLGELVEDPAPGGKAPKGSQAKGAPESAPPAAAGQPAAPKDVAPATPTENPKD